MKKMLFMILIFVCNNGFAQKTCSNEMFCIYVKTPIQTGYFDEYYRMIVSIGSILIDDDKVYERNEITIKAGTDLTLIDLLHIKYITINFLEATHIPGNNEPEDLPQRFEHCEIKFKVTAGVKNILIHIGKDGAYRCHAS